MVRERTVQMFRAEITIPDETGVELSLRPERHVEFIGTYRVKEILHIVTALWRHQLEFRGRPSKLTIKSRAGSLFACSNLLLAIVSSNAWAQAGLSRVEFLALQQELRDQGCGVTRVDARYNMETRQAIATCAKKFNTANNATSLLTAMDIGFGPDDFPVEVTVPTEEMITKEVARVRTYSPNAQSAALAASINYVKVPVFFATRRRPTGKAGAEALFGPNDDHLRFGVAFVSVERRRRPARNDGRGWLCAVIKCEGSIERSVLVAKTDTLLQVDWIKRARSAHPDPQPRALVFVHGFNVGFGDAVKTAGQLAYNTGFDGIVLAFDWASKNDPKKYGPDQATAERSVKDFKSFLRLVADSIRAKPIDVIAHSLGTRLVAYALRDLDSETPNLSVGQLVLAAADIDSATFLEQIVDKVAKHTRRITVYASSNDRALRVSSSDFVNASTRVGAGPPHFILHGHLDYVDASNAGTDFWGHGYYEESKPVIDDIFLLLRLNVPASRRNLAPVQLGSRYYYEMK